MLKRSFDVLLSAVGLVIAAPVLLALAAWIKLDSRGPIFYRGARVGQRSRMFRIYKFRTMVVNADRIGASSTSDDDPRITRAGASIRRYKLDELPQLLNVLAGDMSFVGPRPQVKQHVDLYTDEERALLDVRPGITDFASILYRNEGEILAGSADPDGDYLKLIAPGKLRLGLEYVRTHNLWIDMRLIGATIGAILGVDPAWALPAEWRTHKVTTVRELSQAGS